MAEPIALLALALDAAIGWPAPLYARIGHPVGGFARIIAACERRWNRPGYHDLVRRILGCLTLFLLISIAAGTGWMVERAVRHVAGNWAWPLLALAAWPALAQRSLYDHVLAVLKALQQDDIAVARRSVGMIVGRDTASLDTPGIARAAIESLAESFCDGVVAPLFWLLMLGLPGLWAYKAINSADSLIGHPEPPLRAFGWASARTDDVANLLPARLSAVLLCLAGGGGWRIMVRDHAHHASPNAGWPEAAMAGALGIRLAGPLRYDDVLVEKPWIGEGEAADGDALAHALRICARACGLLWLIAGGIAWLA